MTQYRKNLLRMLIVMLLVFSIVLPAYATESDAAAETVTETQPVATESEVEEITYTAPSATYEADEWIEVSTAEDLLSYMAGNVEQDAKSVNAEAYKGKTVGIKLMDDLSIETSTTLFPGRYAAMYVGYYNADATLAFPVNVVLDLNGHTLTDTSTNSRMIGVYAGSKLVVTNGVILGNGNYKSTGGVIFTSGASSVTLDGVNLVANGYTKTNYGSICNIGNASSALDVINSRIELRDEDKTAARGGLFYISAAAPVNLTNSTFIGGNASAYGGQVAIIEGSVFTATDCTFEGGEAATTGGQFYIGSASAKLTFEGCTFQDGTAVTSGGLFQIASAVKGMKFTDCDFIGGSATAADQAGSGGQFNIAAAAEIAFDNCRFDGGSATGNGGKLYTNKSGIVIDMTNCAFTGGEAGKMGGSIFHKLGTMNLTDCTFDGGIAGTVGGNVCVYYRAIANITGGSIKKGSANNGGNLAAYNADNTSTTTVGKCTVEGTTISDGIAVTTGGNIYQHNTSNKTPVLLTLKDCTVSGGKATKDDSDCGMGGNIYAAGYTLKDADGNPVIYSELVLDKTTLEGGEAMRNGGNLCVAGHARVTVTNGSAFTGGYTVSTDNGGGGNIYMGNSNCSVTIDDATIESGQTKTYGGNIRIGSGTLTVNRGIIRGGSAEKSGHSIYLNDAASAKLKIFGGTISHNSSEGAIVKNASALLNIYSCIVEGVDPAAYVTDCSEIAANESGTVYTVTHKDIDGVTYRDSACNVAGNKVTQCSVCAHTYSYPLDAGHVMIVIPGVEPTCTETGLTEGGHCRFCEENTITQQVIEALGHTYDSCVYTDPTVDADGFYTYTCIRGDDSYTVVVEGTKITSVVFVLQPANAEGDSGSTVTFTVQAHNAVAYQWQYRRNDGTKWFRTTMDGYDTDTLTVNIKAARNGYQYRCLITGLDGGEVSSDPATLTAHSYIEITDQPDAQTVAEGYQSQFTVAAVGETLRYQWQCQLSGSDTWQDLEIRKPTAIIPAVRENEGNLYRCVITDAGGTTVTSEAAALNVLYILSDVSDVDAVPDTVATFAVQTSMDDVKYQWQYSKDEGITWYNTTLTGYKEATLEVPVTVARNGYMYRCVITADKSTITSAAGKLTIGEAPVITQQPESKLYYWDEMAEFTVAADNAYSYRWQYRRNDTGSWYNTTLDGYNTSTLTVKALNSRNGYQYRCKITGTNGDVIYSDAAVLTVGSEEPIEGLEILGQPSSVYASVGDCVIFVVEAKGEQIRYQWQYRKSASDEWTDSALDGSDTEMIFVDVSAPRDGYQFRCIITDVAGNQLISDTATIHVY